MFQQLVTFSLRLLNATFGYRPAETCCVLVAHTSSLCSLSLQPLAQWWRLMPKDAAKMPESAWKLVFYTMSWSYTTYLLFFTSYSFFHDPPSVFYSKTTHQPPHSADN